MVKGLFAGLVSQMRLSLVVPILVLCLSIVVLYLWFRGKRYEEMTNQLHVNLNNLHQSHNTFLQSLPSSVEGAIMHYHGKFHQDVEETTLEEAPAPAPALEKTLEKTPEKVEEKPLVEVPPIIKDMSKSRLLKRRKVRRSKRQATKN
tara:strand:+ start:8167 stop:8607 length:441 start_codon:yes stop_codon:yes gene_type:complete